MFGHFIEDVVLRAPLANGSPAAEAKPPESYRFVGIASTCVPYLLAAALHFGAVFVLYKTVTAFVTADTSSYHPPIHSVALEIALLALLMLGVTAAARLPRLVKTNGLRWHLLAILAFVAGATPAWLWLQEDLGQYLAERFVWAASVIGAPDGRLGVASLLLVAALVAWSGWWVPRNRARMGRRVLLGCGSVAVLAMVVGRLVEADAAHPAWPVLLAGMAFLYLWWLGILVFDLAFVWHRYIRHSVAISTLAQWERGRDAEADVTLRWKRKPKIDSGDTRRPVTPPSSN